MYFGKKADGSLYWGLDKSGLVTCKQIDSDKWMAFIEKVNSSGKTVGIDDSGNPVAETPAEPTYTDEELAAQIESKRASLLAEADKRTTRYMDQVAAGTETTDSEETYKAVLVYKQALRDITTQSTYPKSVTWPTLPD